MTTDYNRKYVIQEVGNDASFTGMYLLETGGIQ
jgi:hypothetical protein